MAKITWLEQTGKYQNGKDCFLGKWKVGSVIWDSISPKGIKLPYRATIRLPGLMPDLGHYEDSEAATEKVEKAIAFWLSKIDKTPPPYPLLKG